MSVDRVLIVGGGIAGLATAAGLHGAGIDCEIVERAERWAPVGAGIVVSVNAMSVMRRLGIAEEVHDRGYVLGRGEITDVAGRSLGASDFGILEAEYGPTVAIHRAALHEALLDATGEVPVTLATSVESLEQTGDQVEARLTNGREMRCDLVIGSDGLRSRVRELAIGPIPLVYSGYTCWRLVSRSPVTQPDMREMWGRGKRFGIVPIGDDRLYCFATANAPEATPDLEEGRVARFRDRFAEFGGQVPQILEALDDEHELIHTDLVELPKVRWGQGRTVLIGDAAHAMTPNMGQGAAMALEDSAVLVELLAAGVTPPELLAELASRRESRVRWVQNQSRRIGQMGQLEGRVSGQLRNALLRLVPDRASAGALRKLASQSI